jgi:hypothetical protein
VCGGEFARGRPGAVRHSQAGVSYSFVPLPNGQLEPNDDDDEEANLGTRSASSQLAKLVRVVSEYSTLLLLRV